MLQEKNKFVEYGTWSSYFILLYSLEMVHDEKGKNEISSRDLLSTLHLGIRNKEKNEIKRFSSELMMGYYFCLHKELLLSQVGTKTKTNKKNKKGVSKLEPKCVMQRMNKEEN